MDLDLDSSDTSSEVSEERVLLDSGSESDDENMDDHTAEPSNWQPEPTVHIPTNTAESSPNPTQISAPQDDGFKYLTTPALDNLCQDLLNGYKLPPKPSDPYNLRPLDRQEELSLQHYTAWQNSGGTVKAYSLHAAVLQNATNVEILSLYKVQQLAEFLTRLSPRRIDMCPKSCIAYTGKYSNLSKCPYISTSTKTTCDEPRFKRKGSNPKHPTAQFTTLPFMATIEALYANADTSRLMRSRDQCLQRVLYLLKTAGDAAEAVRTYSDFGDSYVHVNIHYEQAGLFKDPRDCALALSTDGAQLTMKKHSNTWILILILLNLPPELRYKSKHIMINFAIPGPNSPGDTESFICPLFEELARCSEGIWIWDAIDSSYFTFHAWAVLGLGDMLGSAKINGMSGHAAVYGDRFTNTEAAKASATRGAKAQYYPMLQADVFNPGRKMYSLDDLPMRDHTQYLHILEELEKAQNENQRKKISKATGVARLPLCASSHAFFHPTFFPLDPFHLIYENSMAFIWDLWTVEATPNESMHLSSEKAAQLGHWITDAMKTLPPAFCGPIRDPHLKRQSQYKIYEWMGLLHWYLLPMCLELNFNMSVLENFSFFVRSVEFAMTVKPRNVDNLHQLHSWLVEFLTGFERLYIGNNPKLNIRARLCLFQLIHIPIHIKWNGSIRAGSQASVERSIGEMGHKIRSKKSPFSNLTNIIVRSETVRLLELRYPGLSLIPVDDITNTPKIRPMSCIRFTQSECRPGRGSSTYEHLILLFQALGPAGSSLDFEHVQRWGKLRLPNGRVLQSRISYIDGEPNRKSCWFSV